MIDVTPEFNPNDSNPSHKNDSSTESALATHQQMLDDTFHSVGQAIGIQVMLLVIEHAMWKTKHKYEEAALIRFSEDGIFLTDLCELETEIAERVAHEFITAIVATLGKLVGLQLAEKMTEQLLSIDGRTG